MTSSEAKKIVSQNLQPLIASRLEIRSSVLLTSVNPGGEGIFVYVAKSRYIGVRRLFIWLVIEGQAYPLNGASKNLTPSLPWPRDADPRVWQKTRLNPISAIEAIEITRGHLKLVKPKKKS